MNVLIIEDEIPAAEKLERYLKRHSDHIQVINKITNVKESVEWLKQHQHEVDLLFMDIQLTDGKSFEIFSQVQIEKPIIFTTAFNEYALDAFKVNSIDYLLKPITFSDLSASLDKFEKLKETIGGTSLSNPAIYEALSLLKEKTYKNRFMVKLGEHIKSIATDDITLFYAEGRDVYLITNEKRKFIIDYKLEQLDELLDPKEFYRANRTFILNINAIKDVVMYSNSRLRVYPIVEFEKEIVVSREKVAAFKEWFNGL